MTRTRMQSFKMTRTLTLSGLLLAGLLGSTAVNAFAAAGGSFALTGSMNTARYTHTATLLQNGEVLVTGGLGINGVYAPLASAEIYNPTTAKWTHTGSMSMGRTAFTATLLPNGEVLVAGGTGFNLNCCKRENVRATLGRTQKAGGIKGEIQATKQQHLQS